MFLFLYVLICWEFGVKHEFILRNTNLEMPSMGRCQGGGWECMSKDQGKGETSRTDHVHKLESRRISQGRI